MPINRLGTVFSASVLFRLVQWASLECNYPQLLYYQAGYALPSQSAHTVMDCIACKLPINLADIKYYDCSYDELTQAAESGCPRCSFVLECIRKGAADVYVKEISKVRVWPDFACQIYLEKGWIDLDIFTQKGQEGNPLHISRTRDHLPGATHSQTTIATIQSWIKECATTHGRCHGQVQHVRHPVVYPKRLLDLNEEAVILRENIQQERYACLSHCWGVNADIAKTTTHNLDEFRTCIPWEHFTITFRDAITICRRLGIFYLWIDSLCIIQDSDDDWKDQASQMADIYENAFVTVAATKSGDGSEGCFAVTDQKYLAKLLPGYQHIYVRQRPPLFPSHWGQLERSLTWPLLNRAWIYQEMRLSQRVLHFCAHEVVWVCRTVQRSESGSNDKDFGDSSRFRNTQYESVPYWILQEKPRYLWYRTVQEYSRLRLTFETDRMAALAGLTQRMGSMRPDDRYLAGLWEKTLLFDLLWMVWPRTTPGGQRIARYPSWSWASLNCQVMWRNCIDSTLRSVRVEEIRFVTDGPSHLGESSEAAIILQAPLIDASSLFANYRSAPADPSHDIITIVEQLYVYDYKVDCLPHGSTAARSRPDPSGYVIPLGADTEVNFKFVAIHVRRRPGSEYYERIGSVEVSHPSIVLRFEDKCDRGYDELRTQREMIYENTVRVRELLEGLPTSTIVLV